MRFLEQLPEAWQEQWQASGFNEPSTIQEKSFTPLREGENVLGISPTGTGKTLAYMLPLLLTVEKGQGNQLLIIAPSQELAMQIAEVARTWAKPLQLTVQTLIGGANVSRQIDKLKKRPEVLIGTPGRILELMKNKKVKAQLLKTIVMDEVDQLFQEEELSLTKQILTHTPTEYQLVFYSATADRVVNQAQSLSRKLQVIDVTEEDTSAGQVVHYFIRLAPRKKADYLRRLAHTEAFRSMVFFNQVADLGAAEEKLVYENVPAIGLASDQSKQLRKLAIDQFKAERVKLLLTTDIAARGLDFTGVPYVVNVDVPLTEESYIHRSGRVGRMGAQGAVITFINDGTKRDYQRLMKQLAIPYQEIFLYDGALHEQPKAKDELEKKNVVKDTYSEKKSTKERKPETVNSVVKEPQETRKKKKNKKKNTKNKGARKAKK